MDLVKKQKYLPGVEETFSELKKMGYKIAIISSGPKDLAKRAQKELGVDYIYTNELLIKDGVVVGSKDIKHWLIRDKNKSESLRKLCDEHHIDLKNVIVVVHDDNDIKMARTAGFSIGFLPHADEIKKYCNVIISKRGLREILRPIEEFEKKESTW